MYSDIFGYGNTRVTRAVNAFIEWLCDNWSYLLRDNLEYWKDKIPEFAEKIREACVNNPKYPCPFEPGSFRVFGFIDNTMNASCRPAGGPARSGKNAPRNNRLIQQAFYNGWKKIHGLKWQTVDLPNGMIFHTWGPVSVRHNDLYTLGHSHIIDLISNLQIGWAKQYLIYGDSAYPRGTHLASRHEGDDLTEREKLENKCLSSCRECIEWNYGNCNAMWKMMKFKHALQLRRSIIGKYYFTAMLLFNAYVTMNANQTAEYFNCVPPTLEHWTSRGPIYRPDLLNVQIERAVVEVEDNEFIIIHDNVENAFNDDNVYDDELEFNAE